MSIRIPKNQILFNYTSGKEYLVLSTQKEYQGHYYEINGKFYAGKEFNTSALELIKIDSDKVNSLLLDPKTSTYEKLSKIKLKNNKVTSMPVGGNSKEGDLEEVNFYCKKINTNIIKKIDEETYNLLQNDPLYQTTFTGKNKSLDEAEQEIPGILDWVVSYFRGTSYDETNPYISSFAKQLPPQKLFSKPTPITGSITDTPKPQDIVPVGPIYEKGAIFVPPLT
jgi:hypothetical protein